MSQVTSVTPDAKSTATNAVSERKFQSFGKNVPTGRDQKARRSFDVLISAIRASRVFATFDQGGGIGSKSPMSQHARPRFEKFA